jgi:ABC-type branched-subunit amino acid transport system substrate-binding protein
MGRYYREGNVEDASNVYGYIAAQLMAHVLKQCGNDLSRENIRKQAENVKNFTSGMLLPGIALNTSASDHAPVEQAQLSRFNGKQWVLFGEVLGGSQ